MLGDTPLAGLYSEKNEFPISDISFSSQYFVIWDCPEGLPHTFSRKVAKMGVSKQCPYCSGRKLLSGVSDLETLYPEIAQEFSGKNPLSASSVRAKTDEKVLWDGKCGHTWEMPVKSRTQMGQGCPFCSGQRVLAGFNDFATKRPEELQFWSSENLILPTEVTEKSNKKVKWECSLGHSIEKSPKGWLYSRCGYCSGRKLLVGFNDVFSKAPELEKEWDFLRNTVDPRTLRFNERNYAAFWVCGLRDR